MSPPELAIVRQRFIPRINDGAIKLHPLVDVVHDVIGSLANLKSHRSCARRQIKIKSERMRLTDPSRSGINLPGREKAQQCPQHRRRELSFRSEERRVGKE